MIDYRINYMEQARALWELATGKPPTSADERWGKFLDAVQARLKCTASDALIRAKVAVSCYQPIPVDGMNDGYRAAFKSTRDGCESAVDELSDVVQRW